MSNINAAIVLPELLRNYLIVSLSTFLGVRFGVVAKDSQVWTSIPSSDRHYITLQVLKQSVITKKRDLIGLDFSMKTPIIADGLYWIDAIEDSMQHDLTVKSRNIYFFDNKLSFICFYVEGGTLFVYGNKDFLLKC